MTTDGGSMSAVSAGLAVLVVMLICSGLLWAVSDGTQLTVPLLLPVVLLALVFGIQWCGFFHAWRHQTERYYDIVGSGTFLSVIGCTLWMADDITTRGLLLSILASLWAMRLGWFLFSRITADGGDGRFDSIKTDFWRFLLTWSLQGMWVIITLLPVIAVNTGSNNRELGGVAVLGSLVWAIGFSMEVVVDWQKRQFRLQQHHQQGFIQRGLWSLSRHPNYCGEILLWGGVAIIAFPALTGFQHLALLSPLFVYLLLTRISGIPLLEARAEARWGDDPAYQHYVQHTPVLWPRLKPFALRSHQDRS